MEQGKEILLELRDIKVDLAQVKTNTENHKEQLKQLTSDTNLNNNFRSFCLGIAKVLMIIIMPVILLFVGSWIRGLK